MKCTFCTLREIMRRTYYRTCEFCGSSLDPEEKCDCEKERNYSMRTIENNDKHSLSITAEEVMELMLKGLTEVYRKDGEEAVKKILHMEEQGDNYE